jgi:hypothetical protein
MTDRLDDRLTALHIANASDTSLRLERERDDLSAARGIVLGLALAFILFGLPVLVWLWGGVFDL